MKRLSTGVLTLLMAAGLGFNAVAAQPGASHGNIGTNAIAQDQGCDGCSAGELRVPAVGSVSDSLSMTTTSMPSPIF